MEREADDRGVTLIELVVAATVVGIVLVAAALSPSLGVQAALTGVAILLNLRSGRR